MSDLFNKVFVDRVNDVFNNHQETYNPNDWQKLRSKMNRRQRKVIVMWPHIAKAASIILFLGVAVFTANKYEVKKNVSAIKKENFIKPNNEDNLVLNNVDTMSQVGNSAETYLVAEANHEGGNNKGLNIYTENEVYNSVSKEDSSIFDNISNNRFTNVKVALNDHHNEIKQMDKEQSNSNRPDLVEYNDIILAENQKENGRFDVGVELASVSNYSSEGSGNGINIGGGLTAAYRVTNKIRITTGVLIAKQSIEYAPENNYQMAYADYEELNTAHFADNQVVENVSSSGSEVSFVAIDIPLNLQFKHNRLSFSTGFSSLLFVQEKYNRTYSAVVSNRTYNWDTKRYDVRNSVETVSKDETTEPFEHFDFARLLNFSVGYDIPIAKGGLTVEPYLKYPLGKIGTKEVFMGAGGVALRYNF